MSKYKQIAEQYAEMVTDTSVRNDVAKLLEKKVDENSKEEVYRTLLGCLDLTSLNFEDNDQTISELVNRVNAFGEEHADLPNVAAVCVFPSFVEAVHNNLEDSDIATVTVVGGFPFSQTYSEVKVAETSLAILDGADEVDMVLPRGTFLSGDYEAVCDEIEEVKSATHGKKLKVILETGAFSGAREIISAAAITAFSGADFIKTSTGKITTGATPEAVFTICKAIKRYNDEHKRMIGIKVSGGVSTVEQAVQYYTIVKEVLGEAWLTKDLFRIGASKLANKLVEKLTGEAEDCF